MVIVTTATFLLVFFYLIPITFVQSLANLKELSIRLPFLCVITLIRAALCLTTILVGSF